MKDDVSSQKKVVWKLVESCSRLGGVGLGIGGVFFLKIGVELGSFKDGRYG
jgi:hypothetical protein